MIFDDFLMKIERVCGGPVVRLAHDLLPRVVHLLELVRLRRELLLDVPRAEDGPRRAGRAGVSTASDRIASHRSPFCPVSI